ncbi:MAG: PEP-CTERM sorting domain-containing protein [Desulfuromonadaceae bacterium]
MKRFFFALLLCGVVAGGFASSANAVAITYEGELFDGITAYGSISDPFETGSDWWFFHADAGDVITLTVNRLDANLDPAFYLYLGMQSDTSTLPAYSAEADDEIVELPGYEGPFADPQLSGFAISATGIYSVAVWDFASGTVGPFDYQIQLDGANPAAVPEPSSIMLLGFGLAGIACACRKTKKA